MAGNNCNIKNNIVMHESTSNRQSIRCEGQIEDDLICDNIVKNSKIGILLVNNMPSVKITTNKFIGDGSINNQQYGLEIHGNIPIQKHEGNHWEGSKFLFEAFLDPSLVVDGTKNAFKSRNDNYLLPTKYWPTLVNRVDWFKDDKTVIYPNSCILPLPPSIPCLNNNDNQYMSDSLFRNTLSQGERWDNDSYFYKYINSNPTCLISSDQTDLYNSILNCNISNYQTIEKRIDEFYKLEPNINEYLNLTNLLIDSLYKEILLQINLIDPLDSTVLDSSYVIISSEEVLHKYENDLDSIIQIIDTNRQIEFNSLNFLIENLAPINSYDSLYKQYYKILLKNLVYEDYTSQESEFLYYLSRQCPKTFGNITYKANALISGIDHLESLNENCATQQIVLYDKKVIKSIINCLVSIYPNPVTNIEKIVISTECQLIDTKIIDIYGKEVYAFLDKDKTMIPNKSVLNVSNLTPGIYFIKLTLSNGQSIQRKIIIK